MSLAKEGLEVGQRAVRGMDGGVVGDVVAVVLQWRRIERQEPDDVDAEVLEVIEFARQTFDVADAVGVRVEERLDVGLVDDCVFVPEVCHGSRLSALGSRRAGPRAES